MLSNFILKFINNQNIDIQNIDDLDINNTNPINIQIYEENNRILAEEVAALFSNSRAFDTGYTLKFDQLNDYKQHSFLNQVFAAKSSQYDNIIDIAKDIHLAYCHMWIYYRVKYGVYISDEFMCSWEQLDDIKKREYVFIALAINAPENEDTSEAAERLLQETCDILLNEF
jgi:hypothetical protein